MKGSLDPVKGSWGQDIIFCKKGSEIFEKYVTKNGKIYHFPEHMFQVCEIVYLFASPVDDNLPFMQPITRFKAV